MVAVKAHQAQAFLAAKELRQRAVLFFGSDAGLVAERALAFARAAAAKFSPPGELLRIDDADLDSDPDRLITELKTVAMFGGPKVVRVQAGRRINAAMLKSLVDGSDLEGVLIVEAGNLKPDEGVRPLFEKSASAAAVACYSDGAQDLEALVRDVLGEAGLKIAADARDALVDRLGADRALSRGEIEKLALYAQGKGQIEIDDVDAVVGDVSELALDRISNAAALGQTGRALEECVRAVTAGESPQAIVIAVQRHFFRLHRVKAALDRGRSLDDALREIRPPLHFKQKDAFAVQLRLWTLPRLGEALKRIATGAKAARLASALEEPLVERMVLGLSMLAHDGRARGRA